MAVRSRAALGACACLTIFLGACVPSAPRFGPPVRIEAFCGSKEARSTGIRSVITSTDDTILDDRPTEAEVRRAASAGDGAIVYWNDQLLSLPKASQALGESDGYARLLEAAIPPALLGATTRHIYLLVRDHGKPRWITMQAFDVQNICVEGKRDI